MLPHFTDEETEFQRDEGLSLSGWASKGWGPFAPRGWLHLRSPPGLPPASHHLACTPALGGFGGGGALSASPENSVFSRPWRAGPVGSLVWWLREGPGPAFLMHTRPAPPPAPLEAPREYWL